MVKNNESLPKDKTEQSNENNEKDQEILKELVKHIEELSEKVNGLEKKLADKNKNKNNKDLINRINELEGDEIFIEENNSTEAEKNFTSDKGENLAEKNIEIEQVSDPTNNELEEKLQAMEPGDKVLIPRSNGSRTEASWASRHKKIDGIDNYKVIWEEDGKSLSKFLPFSEITLLHNNDSSQDNPNDKNDLPPTQPREEKPASKTQDNSNNKDNVPPNPLDEENNHEEEATLPSIRDMFLERVTPHIERLESMRKRIAEANKKPLNFYNVNLIRKAYGQSVDKAIDRTIERMERDPAVLQNLRQQNPEEWPEAGTYQERLAIKDVFMEMYDRMREDAYVIERTFSGSTGEKSRSSNPKNFKELTRRGMGELRGGNNGVMGHYERSDIGFYQYD